MKKEILSFCVVFLIGVSVMAQTWDATFPQDISGGKVTGTDLKIMVSGAGELSFEASEAARSLAKAVRKVSGVKLVMTGEALGDLTTAADEDVVEKSKIYKVDFTYVVRVFEGSSADTFAAVVTIYDADGEAVVNISGEKGTPVSDVAGEATQGDEWGEAPASNDGLESTPSSEEGWGEQPAQPATDEWGNAGPAAGMAAGTGAAAPKMSSTEEYAARYIWFEDWVAMDVDSGGVAARWTVPYKGKDKELLKGSRFYTYIKKDDLAKQYKKRSILKWSLFGGGGAVMLGGLGVLLAGLLKDVNFDDRRFKCDDAFPSPGEDLDNCHYDVDQGEANAKESRKTLTIVGAVVAAAGAGTLFAGVFYKAHPVPAEEGRKLADWFNKDLKKDLGLESAYQVPQTSRLKLKEPPKLDITPVIAGATNGVVVNLSF